MTGFEPRISGVGSNCSTNYATNTALLVNIFVRGLYTLWGLFLTRFFFITYTQLAVINVIVPFYLDFFKWVNSGIFLVYFRSFQTNNTIFVTNQCEFFMYIQYMAQGFKPTTSQTRVVSHNH